MLDIGCGGGLLSEPVARMGASVVGADPSEKNIGIASSHAKASGVSVDYRAVTAEELTAAGETFDIVLNMEVVEHVADVEFFITTCAKMVRPGGLIFVATINRTMKAAALAIFAAENILRWLPRGTHQYENWYVRKNWKSHWWQAALRSPTAPASSSIRCRTSGTYLRIWT